MRLESFFLKSLGHLGWGVYLVIFLAMLVEGEMVLFTTIYLAESHFLKIRILIPVLFAGAFTGDNLWYFVGGYLERKIPWVRKWFGHITKPINKRLAQRPDIVIFVSKFTYGLNRATLMRAGAHPVKYGEFLKTELFTIFCWMSVIGNLAYLSALSSGYFRHYLKYAEIGLLVGIVFMSLCIHVFTVIARKMIAANGKKETK
jgi:membrane protein DedA with SNARE-associated domain